MKATFKNLVLSLSVLAAVLAVLTVVDGAIDVDAKQSETYLRLVVVDLNNEPVHNAKITVENRTFFTDNKGLSPNVQLQDCNNVYDSSITEWFTTNVFVRKDEYVPAVVMNCVVYNGETRKLTVKIYPVDSSDLPYVCYVESPPDDYMKKLLAQ